MYDTLISSALQHASLDDDLDTALEDQLRRMFALDAELDIHSLQDSPCEPLGMWP